MPARCRGSACCVPVLSRRSSGAPTRVAGIGCECGREVVDSILDSGEAIELGGPSKERQLLDRPRFERRNLWLESAQGSDDFTRNAVERGSGGGRDFGQARTDHTGLTFDALGVFGTQCAITRERFGECGTGDRKGAR